MKNILLFLLLASSFGANAQQTATVDSLSLVLSGKVVEGAAPLYGVNIQILSTGLGTSTAYDGTFVLRVNKGDSLKFSYIGYKSIQYNISDTITAESFRILVNMVADTILLRETVIVPWPLNRTMLKQAMLENRPEEKETVGAFAGFREIEGDPEEPKAKVSNPISFLYEKFNKKARQQKKIEKYREMLRQDEYFEDEHKP